MKIGKWNDIFPCFQEKLINFDTCFVFRAIDVKWMITKAQANCMIDESANNQAKINENHENIVQHFEIAPVNPAQSMNSNK